VMVSLADQLLQGRCADAAKALSSKVRFRNTATDDGMNEH
jgi:hypothetical protein